MGQRESSTNKRLPRVNTTISHEPRHFLLQRAMVTAGLWVASSFEMMFLVFFLFAPCLPLLFRCAMGASGFSLVSDVALAWAAMGVEALLRCTGDNQVSCCCCFVDCMDGPYSGSQLMAWLLHFIHGIGATLCGLFLTLCNAIIGCNASVSSADRAAWEARGIPSPNMPKFMRHECWTDAVFLHWRLEPEALQAVLPVGLEPHLDSNGYAHLYASMFDRVPTVWMVRDET